MVEQAGQHGLLERRAAGEPAARRVADARAAAGRPPQVDELRRRECRPAVGECEARREIEPRRGGEGLERKVLRRQLARVEECEPPRVDGCRAELLGGGQNEALVRHVRRRVPLDRLAERRSPGLQVVGVRAAAVVDRGRSERAPGRADGAGPVPKSRVVGRIGRANGCADDPDERRDRLVQPSERRCGRRERPVQDVSRHELPRGTRGPGAASTRRRTTGSAAPAAGGGARVRAPRPSPGHRSVRAVSGPLRPASGSRAQSRSRRQPPRARRATRPGSRFRRSPRSPPRSPSKRRGAGDSTIGRPTGQGRKTGPMTIVRPSGGRTWSQG